MADERIEVEYIATTQQMLKAFEKLNSRLEATEKNLARTGEAGKKAATLAEGSFAKLEKELKDNEKALKNLAIGSREFENQKKKVDALRTSLAGARSAMSSTAGNTSAMSSAMTSALTSAKNLAVTYVGIGAAVRAITFELEKQKRLKIEAAGTERTFEQALADLGQNIGGENLGAARQMISERAPELGVDQAGLANLLGTAISAGAKDLDEAMSLTAATLKLTVGDAARAQTLVGGTLDVASLGGSDNFEGALGQLLQVQSQVRSTNLAEFAANIGSGLAAATSQGQNMQGVSTERALEMSAVVSQIIKDQSGSNTATTIRNFFTRLDSFTPERSVKLDDGGTAEVSKEGIAAFKAAKTFDERLALMRQDKNLALQFLETQRESIGKVAIREIVTGEDRALKFEEKAAAAISSIDDAVDEFTTLADNLETPALVAERQAAANLERKHTVGLTGLEGQAFKIFQDTMENIDLPGADIAVRQVNQKYVETLIANGTDGITAAIMGVERASRPQGLFEGELTAGDKNYAEEQVRILEDLLKSFRALEARQNANAANPPPAAPVPVVVQPPAARPKEAPLPAKLIP